MMSEALRGMTGEELLVLRVLGGEGVAPAIDRELDRRARACPSRHVRGAVDWAARTHAIRHSARLAEAA